MKDLTFRELADYTSAETHRWRDWLATASPAVLELPVGGGRTATARGLIHHIIVVERRYIDRLRGDAVTTYEAVPQDPIADTFRWFDEGRARFGEWIGSVPDAEMARVVKFETISAGTFEVSVRKVIAHMFVHGIRHWAQLATAVRQHGYATDWQHDILMSDALA
jgi:uncharacterized damage-inducible protein DinB